MKFSEDNRSGMILLNRIMVRGDVTDDEKKKVSEIQRDLLRRPETYKLNTDSHFFIKHLWWRGERKPGGRRVIKVEVYYGAYETSVGCIDCHKIVWVRGSTVRSARRGCIMLRDQCPWKENNYY